MRILVLISFVVMAASSGFSQVDADMKKRLESDLYKKTPYVRSAKLEGCRLKLTVDIKYDSGFHPFAGSMPNAMPTEGVLNPPFGSGSASRNIILFDVLLNSMLKDGVKLSETKRKEHSLLQVSGERNSITRTWSGKSDTTNAVDLVVNKKDAETVAKTLRKVIIACQG